MLYGKKKIGKTSLASHFPNPLFLMFEPGAKALKVHQTPTITDWAQFRKYIDDLTDTEHTFQTIVVDPIEVAYKRCLACVCEEQGISHPSDENDFGKTWGLVRDEYTFQMQRLMDLEDCGVLFLAHDIIKEHKRPLTGETYSMTTAELSKGAAQFFVGVSDIISYYTYVGNRRYLLIDGFDDIEAGCRAEDHFQTVDGRKVKAIDMGTTSREAYDNLIGAWENKLENPLPEDNPAFTAYMAKSTPDVPAGGKSNKKYKTKTRLKVAE